MTKKLSENGALVLNFLRENDGELMTAIDIADALDLSPKQVNGIVTRGFKSTSPDEALAVRVEKTVEDENGKPKILKFIQITELGRTVEIEE